MEKVDISEPASDMYASVLSLSSPLLMRFSGMFNLEMLILLKNQTFIVSICTNYCFKMKNSFRFIW